jgi:hypothetical protein
MLSSIPLLYAMLLISACSQDSEKKLVDSGNRSYQAAGSRWEVTMSNQNFTLRQFANLSATTAAQTITGSVTTNAVNRFKTLTVAANDGDGPTTGQSVVALEMPNVGAFIQPPEGAIPLVAIASGSCPGSNFSANWVVTKPFLSSDNGQFRPDSFDEDGVGTAVFTAGTDNFLVRAAGVADGVLESEEEGGEFAPLGMSSCTAGKLAVNGNGEVFDMYFTSTGQMVVKFPETMGNQIISGLPQTAADVQAATVAGTYSVLLYRGNFSSQADLSEAMLEPARLTIANGAGQIRLITNVANNTEETSDLYTLTTFSNKNTSNQDLPKGQFRFTISDVPGGTLACATSDSGIRPIMCYGYFGTGGTRSPVTIIGHIR